MLRLRRRRVRPAHGPGADATVKVSDDGGTWKRYPVGSATMAGVGFGGGVFLAMAGNTAEISRDLGKTWQQAAYPNGGMREADGAGPGTGVFVGGSDGNPPVVSYDRGNKWEKLTDCPGVHTSNLGQEGGSAYGNGATVIQSSNGDFCKVVDRQVVKRGNVGGPAPGKIAWVGDEFFVPAGTSGFRSADGETWQKVTFAPAGTNVRSIARSDEGTFVGVSYDVRDAFFRSTDGVTWTKVAGPTGPRLIKIKFGRVGRRPQICGS